MPVMATPSEAPVRVRMPSARARATGLADRAGGGDELGRDIGKGGLEGVAVDDGAAEEVARASGNCREARGEQAAGAALGGGQGEVAECRASDRTTSSRLSFCEEKIGVFHLGLDAAGEFVDASLCFGESGLRCDEVKLYLSVTGKDGGFDVGVFTIDRRGASVDVRFGNERHAKNASREMFRRRQSG